MSCSVRIACIAFAKLSVSDVRVVYFVFTLDDRRARGECFEMHSRARGADGRYVQCDVKSSERDPFQYDRRRCYSDRAWHDTDVLESSASHSTDGAPNVAGSAGCAGARVHYARCVG